MIPKIIHYCWFGGKPLPAAAQKCIASWKKYCPDYEIHAWTEENYDIASAPLYVRQAYEAKKWAFVSDYVRLLVVYKHGGIYLDTDVELLKNLDPLRGYSAYFGFEDGLHVATGLGFGAESHSQVLANMMLDYQTIPFLLDNGSYDLTACPVRNTDALVHIGLVCRNEFQLLPGNIAVFPTEYFCPRDIHTMEIRVTENTYTIHHFAGSWLPKEDLSRRSYKLRKLRVEKRLGPRWANLYETLHYARKKNGGAGLERYIKNRLLRIFRKRGR